MIRPCITRCSRSRLSVISRNQFSCSSRLTTMVRGAVAIALFGILLSCAHAQVITVDTSGKNATTPDGAVDRRYQQIQPTRVDLSKTEIDAKTRIDLLRVMQAEQGFAMRPLPRG